MNKDSAILKEARDCFDEAMSAWRHNLDRAVEDIRFARLDEQWPEHIRRQREAENRPILTINKMRSFIRQVVNDARINRPAIRVVPVDDHADKATADLLTGIIRNIEASSKADIAYDTAVDNSVSGGFGWIRVNLAYSCDDTFDQDIVIKPIANAAAVVPDPLDESQDGSEQNETFVTTRMGNAAFKRRFPGAASADWDGGAWGLEDGLWRTKDDCLVAEWWRRTPVDRKIIGLSDGSVVGLDVFEANAQEYYAKGIEPVTSPRTVKSHKVTQYLLNGAEVLEKVEWVGRHIPIIPVWGDELRIEGERHLQGLIRSAKDSQRMFNYWRTLATELIALAPKAPWIGPVGAFETDTAKWATANQIGHSFIEYDPVPNAPAGGRPERQPFSGVPVGVIQEALNANDDMKAVIGIYDASLGARSNETSGRAINARQRESDVSTFHFIDNLSRAIRHTGVVVIDLIPHVYPAGRIARVLGEDNESRNVPIGQPVEERDEKGNPVQRIYDLAAGKYDIVVKSGPSFSTRREEAVNRLVQLAQMSPDIAPIVADIVLELDDFPESDRASKRLQALLPPQVRAVEDKDGPDPQVQQLQQQLQEAAIELQALRSEAELKAGELQVKAFDAETKRIQATSTMFTPEQAAAIAQDAVRMALDGVGTMLTEAMGPPPAPFMQPAPEMPEMPKMPETGAPDFSAMPQIEFPPELPGGEGLPEPFPE